MLRGFYFVVCWIVLGARATEWNCAPKGRFCIQWIERPLSWEESRLQCTQIGAELPGPEHLSEMRDLMQGHFATFWTSLCFNQGKLQWLGAVPREERNIPFIDELKLDLNSPHAKNEKSYCFSAGGDLADPVRTFGLSMEHTSEIRSGICVSDQKSIKQLEARKPKGRIISAEVVSLGADIDWGPVGQDRQGFMNIFPLKVPSLKLKCEVQTTDPDVVVDIRWRRNGGYMGNNSQIIDFSVQEDLIPWIGTISCEAVQPNQQEVVRGQGFHVALWNTVTLRLVTECTSCSLESVLDAAKTIFTKFVDVEITSGLGKDLEFYQFETPDFDKYTTSVIVHLRNNKIDKFDFKMVKKLGVHFQLSLWAKDHGIPLPDNYDILVETISPCNMELPQDQQFNISWIGYLGQVVPSNNFIGGPICVDKDGDIITRSCGIPSAPPNVFKECAAMKERREEPKCSHGFELADGRCYRMTEPTDFDDAVSQCWAGWQIQEEILHEKLSNWMRDSINLISRARLPIRFPLIWLPLRRQTKTAPLQSPIWSWNITVNDQWIPEPNTFWSERQAEYGIEEQCAAFDLELGQMVSQSCQSHLPMICTRSTLPQPLMELMANRSDNVGEYFCPPGWISHLLVLEAGLCYRRVQVKDAVTWDGAQQECIRHGGHLATAPTHILRVVLEQTYGFFNNQSLVDSWIGLRTRGEQPGAFQWANQTNRQISSTYTWQPYNEFGVGYGVSTGLTRMWWNWPRQVRQWGMMCQKTVLDWKQDISLHLEPSSTSRKDGDYDLIFSYDPNPSHDESVQSKPPQRSSVRKTFWQAEFDVLCHFADHVQRFSIPIGEKRQYRVLVSVPSTLGSGPLTCEAWLNRPAHRFHSNTIIHRPTKSPNSAYYVPTHTHESMAYRAEYPQPGPINRRRTHHY